MKRQSKYVWTPEQLAAALARVTARVEAGSTWEYARACTVKSASYGGSVRPRTSIVWAVRMPDGSIRTWHGMCDSWQACNGFRQLPEEMRRAVEQHRKEAK